MSRFLRVTLVSLALMAMLGLSLVSPANTLDVVDAGSTLKLSLTAPNRVVVGEEIPVTVRVTNVSTANQIVRGKITITGTNVVTRVAQGELQYGSAYCFAAPVACEYNLLDQIPAGSSESLTIFVRAIQPGQIVAKATLEGGFSAKRQTIVVQK